MKIQLIHPPADEEFRKKQVEYLTAPPVGLYLLEGGIKAYTDGVGREINVEILDGNLLTMEEVIKRVDGDVIGVSSWYSKHRNAIKITEVVKKKNPDCVTVIGGPNVTHLGEIILLKRPSVDFVFSGNAEHDFGLFLLRSRTSSSTANMWGRNGFKEPFFTFKENRLMNIIFDPDYIHQSYKKTPFPVSFLRGCVKAVKTGRRCSFCSLSYKGIDVMESNLVWKQINILWEKHGIDYFFETGDSFIPGYYKKLIKTRPENLQHIKFRIYAGPQQINENTIEILKDMNVKEVFLGLETNSDLVLKRAFKDYGYQDELRALELLSKAGILIQTPFIFGLPGSTPETEKKNYCFADHVVKNYNIHSLLVSMPVPLVGSELYKMVTGGGIESDIIDYYQLTQRLVAQFSECSFEQVEEFIQKTSLLTKESGGFGITR